MILVTKQAGGDILLQRVKSAQSIMYVKSKAIRIGRRRVVNNDARCLALATDGAGDALLQIRCAGNSNFERGAGGFVIGCPP